MTHDTRHMTCDKWNVTSLGGWTFSQNFSFLALTVCDLWYYEDLEEKAHGVTESMNDEAVYRTAPATPGLLNTSSKKSSFVQPRLDLIFKSGFKTSRNECKIEHNFQRQCTKAFCNRMSSIEHLMFQNGHHLASQNLVYWVTAGNSTITHTTSLVQQHWGVV